MAAPPLELSKSSLKLPKGWREALYAETDNGWVSAHGGVPKEQPLPSSPQRSGGAGRPNALLVELLASRPFIDDYFEKLPLLVRRGEDSGWAPPRQPLCSLSEDQLLMREFQTREESRATRKPTNPFARAFPRYSPPAFSPACTSRWTGALK